MSYFRKPILPVFAALTVGITPLGYADTISATQPLTFLETIAVATDQQQDVLRKWTIASGGLFTLRVPANTGIQISVDGAMVIDATGSRLADVGQTITALMTLEAGDHAVRVSGVSEENLNIAMITVNAAGQTAQPFFSQTSAIDQEEADAILASRAAISAPNGGTGQTANAGLANDRTPFQIGGGSSGRQRALNNAPAPVDGVQMAGANVPMQGMSGGNMGQSGSTTSAGTSGVASTTPGGGVLASSGDQGGLSGGGTVSGGGGVTGGGTATPGEPTPVATPTTPPATPDPVMAADVSPLTPPTVAPTEMVQLLSAGGDSGLVAASGATLFGAVMDSSLFDQVNVSIAPMNRTATVDVGPETGQFAVRLFEEDFAQGPEVTVTLTGALSSSPDVQSTPISYPLTAAPVTNGISQALSRLTYGATPELYARVRAIGFEAFVQEQLDPNLDDSSFLSTRPQDLLNMTTRSQSTMFNSLMAHDIAYAAFSERQLREVMANFWANHFHAVTKGTEIRQQNITDRAFFRENAFGNFEDMLMYSARSPLMSQYLDNDENRRGRNNQNYAREILELSTVGVNAGYATEDIDAIAQVFSGWAYRRTNEADGDDVAREYEFAFFPDRHDLGDKVIPFLNLTIAGRDGDAGVAEGEELISVLAQNGNTRGFVCGKIVQLLVSDQPPAALISACADAWQQSDGEVIPMLEAILFDPSYIQNAEFQRTKIKNPFEFAVSAMRAFGANPTADTTDNFYRRFREVVESGGYVPLYFPAPTGMPEVGAAWTSSAKLSATYERMNAIAEGRQNYGIDLLDDITVAGLETAEEVAIYLLTVATADRFTLTEYNMVVDVIKGADAIFEPMSDGANETAALERAMGVVFVTPSFLLQ